MNSNGKFLTFEEFQNKFEIKANYLRYIQFIAAISPDLKRKAFGCTVPDPWGNFRVLFAPVPCNASRNKSSASHFFPVRVRIHSLCLPIIVLLRWLTNRSGPGQCYTSSSSASNSPIASTMRMTDFPSPVFRWRYILPVCLLPFPWLP